MTTNRILVKLHPTTALRAAASRVPLEPLYSRPTEDSLSVNESPQWFIAEMPEGAARAWDVAHARVADQLGIAESDVIAAEPDIIHDIFEDPSTTRGAFAVGEDCGEEPQDAGHGKATGPGFAWHLDKAYSQLDAARSAVSFSDPRIRIAHIDTGYSPTHKTLPRHLRVDLGHSFVDTDADPDTGVNPGGHGGLMDNHDHGTGTLSILAGKDVPSHAGTDLGGAPDAEVVPLRVADSVILLRTSALARAFDYATNFRCDVVTLSMGGLPSDVWGEAVDRAYELGVCICAAAGNHKGALPPKVVVYPARYPRVIAVCGVMANGSPYANLDGALEGSFGPDSAMTKAIAAFTPNIPWAKFGCDDVVRLNGEGTSAATPQVAAAVALWFERYKGVLPRDYRRVEAVRQALFSTAARSDRTHFGNGVLKAFKALDIKPQLNLPKSDVSKNSWAFLRLITGLGITEEPVRERMLNLELMQRWLVNPELQAIVPDPERMRALPTQKLKAFMQAVVEDAGASDTLRKHVAGRYPVVHGGSAARNRRSKDVIPDVLPACDPAPAVMDPPFRTVRVYAIDPSLSSRLDTAAINDVALKIRWEQKLGKGPSGEYVRVEDVDAAGKRYKPVDLDDPRLLAQNGWAPAEGNPQFHQQMVYTVAMKTIESFEAALGRPVLWRPWPNPKKEYDDSVFVPQLVIRPHALRQANAYYSPQTVDLKFGYFEAAENEPGEFMPGSRVYSCMSHDIVAHETTHAILDGMHRRFNQPTNDDVLAFHEAFADIVAIMQHFTMPEIVEHEIARVRGDLEAESLLGSLAVQFGYATGGRGALRDAIGTVDKDGKWTRSKPDPTELQKRLTPHSRGAILVAAVFDAFIAMYKTRIEDLLRLSTGGTGVLPNGAIHPDLVRRLADEATRAATHVLNMCIRALDYLPPVDVTFFEYLRAIITADMDVVADDRYNYRVAFVEAFRRRGIYPLDLNPTSISADTIRTLGVDTLRWSGVEELKMINPRFYLPMLELLKSYANECFYLRDREELFTVTRTYREKLHEDLKPTFRKSPAFAKELGLDPANKVFEVHALRRSLRTSPDGSRHIPQLIIALTQEEEVPAQGNTPSYTFRGGSTLIVDLTAPAVKYRITKRIGSKERRQRTAAFMRAAAADPLRGLFIAPDRRDEPFAALHALSGTK